MKILELTSVKVFKAECAELRILLIKVNLKKEFSECWTISKLLRKLIENCNKDPEYLQRFIDEK